MKLLSYSFYRLGTGGGGPPLGRLGREGGGPGGGAEGGGPGGGAPAGGPGGRLGTGGRGRAGAFFSSWGLVGVPG